MNILVTGIAGDIGTGIGRILQESRIAHKLLGCDIHGEHLGASIFDACYLMPPASSPEYLETLKSFVKENEIQGVVVSAEPELRFFAGQNEAALAGLPLVMANRLAMQTGFDKLATADFIRGIGCEAPWTTPIETEEPQAFPCILKSRTGAGSRSIFLVKDATQVEAYRALFKGFVWQEFIPGDSDEYTCGLYGCTNGEIRTIIFRRRLAGGLTGYAELVKNDTIEALCVRIGTALQLRGSINVQLRLGVRGPLVFEINPRFSSTVAFRHRLGFTDVLWSLQEQILAKETAYHPTHPPGTRIYRTSSEVVMPPV